MKSDSVKSFDWIPTHTHVERGNIRQGKEVCPHVFNPIAEREREREGFMLY